MINIDKIKKQTEIGEIKENKRVNRLFKRTQHRIEQKVKKASKLGCTTTTYDLPYSLLKPQYREALVRHFTDLGFNATYDNYYHYIRVKWGE